jgi:anti-sigma regulatory factor (Ser/Thr protein kinase)
MSQDESARLSALGRYRILDTEPERAFDDLTLLATQICGTPVALLSLIDSDRQWFKSRVGVSADSVARSASICHHVVERRETVVVPDALADDRFRENPMVAGEPHFRFYAGAPLVTPEGHAIGTLCVVDYLPRQLSRDQLAALEALRRQAEAQLELRRNLLELREALDERDKAEAEQTRLVSELRAALGNVRRLAGLMPFCSTCQINMVIPADPWKIPDVTGGVVELLRERKWSESRTYEVELALQEALANAIRHGCNGDPTKQVQCCVTFDDSGDVIMVVRDPGQGFDAGAVPNPLEGDNVLKSSGRGVYLINELMDEVRFEDGGRQVEMRKRGGSD